MDKEIASFNHNITITERKNIVISGIKKIDNFDDKEFLLETTMGHLLIRGSELEIIKLDTYQGNVSIKGNFNNLCYTDSSKKEKDDGFFNKLFK